MRLVKIVLIVFTILCQRALAAPRSSQTPNPSTSRTKRIVIAASKLLDGKGGALRNARIVIEGSKIVAVYAGGRAKTSPADYDLRGLTVLPGWIDAHVHISWSFGPDGKNLNE